ncbi:MAG: type I pullulanase [Chitinophagales bacterium]
MKPILSYFNSSLFNTIIIAMTLLSSCQNPEKQQEKILKDFPTSFDSFEAYPKYEGTDLGLTYTPTVSTFKIWAPTASEAKINLYETGIDGEAIEAQNMNRLEGGIWRIDIEGDFKGKYYTFQTKVNGKWLEEALDPYVKIVGVNGKRGVIADLNGTNPEGWGTDKRPPLQNFTDIILYELHIRDLSIHPSSGVNAEHRGKYLGLTQEGTKNADGLSTSLDHIKELGITHVHLLPTFDHRSIDETKLDTAQFNWGYDPLNYNAPEGSFSTYPHDGTTRIKEFKQMVKTFHDAGIRVVMDVVYNHTGLSAESYLEQIVPDYYYRKHPDNSFSNASGCGNETASERAMVRKFMIESVKYWAEEYHIDGFRFDLMAIHDIETMNQIRAALDEIDPTIFVYGEGWTSGDSPLPVEKRALKHHTPQLNNIAAFSDDLRDGLKGSVFNHEEQGFVSGANGKEETMKFGIVASTQHPQIDYKKVNYSDAFWANNPTQCINYVSCHDNHTLFDRLLISNKTDDEATRLKMHQMAMTIVLTSQGVSFLHAGSEIARTKNGEENSYKSPDSINQIDWSRKTQYQELFDYYKKLIALRKAHPAFRMPTTEMLAKHLTFLELEAPNENLVAYQISDNANGDTWKNIVVILNGNRSERKVKLPEGEWKMVLTPEWVDENGVIDVSGEVRVPGTAAMVLAQ